MACRLCMSARPQDVVGDSCQANDRPSERVSTWWREGREVVREGWLEMEPLTVREQFYDLLRSGIVGLFSRYVTAIAHWRLPPHIGENHAIHGR